MKQYTINKGTRNRRMEMLLIIYMILGYWAVGKTIYKNKILIGDFVTIFMRKLIFGMFLGWILIPIAIVSSLIGRG